MYIYIIASRRIGKTPMYTKHTGTWHIGNFLDISGLHKLAPTREDTGEDNKDDSAAEFLKIFALGKTKKKKNRPKKRKKLSLMKIRQAEEVSYHSSKRSRCSMAQDRAETEITSSENTEETGEKRILLNSLKLKNCSNAK